ncbi:MAG: Inositol-1-monophosphatase [Methanomassiliicoccales archaeon PtaU1.Bin124]|nr:MAG: Inositol-1-monophosphatase [Methanomassiliicoccales archaeon PtaU1.Bin124]
MLPVESISTSDYVGDLMLHHLSNIADRVQRVVKAMPSTCEMGEELCMGADGTPTLRIDRLAEDAILEYVNQEKLKWNILSEEAGYIDNGGDRTLVIDPIDGTYNAVIGIPFYSVSLALGSSTMSDVDMAYVRNVVTGDTYQAVKGEGAKLNGRKIHTRPLAKDMVLLIYMGCHASDDTLRCIKKARRTRSLGCSSLELALVAQGTADAFYLKSGQRERAIRVVDIAASALILREAGGDLCDLSGETLDMPFDLKVRSNFLAYGDQSVKGVLL